MKKTIPFLLFLYSFTCCAQKQTVSVDILNELENANNYLTEVRKKYELIRTK